MKKINLLGSTGSIGTQALEVAERSGYKVTALAAGSNIELLEKQASKEENCIKVDLSKFSKFKKSLKEFQSEIFEQEAVLIAPSQFRQVIFILVSQLYLDIPVVCYEEIAPEYKLTILGKI